MKYILNSKQMKSIDQYSIEKTGIPSLVLMERAALCVAQGIQQAVSANPKKDIRVLCVCGKGNNGADGLAAARQLFMEGYATEVYLAGGSLAKGTYEYEVQLNIIKNLNISIINQLDLNKYDVIVDAIFGIGLSRDITGELEDLINRINAARAANENQLIVAIDAPSGVNASTGHIMNCVVKADITITFGYNKVGLILYPGKNNAGIVEVKQIGFAPDAINYITDKAFTYEINDIKRIPIRKKDGNKGTFGKLLIVAGSEKIAGAACLCAMAAYRSGCGMVQVYTHEINRNVLLTILPEAMVTVYKDDEAKETKEDKLLRLIEWSDCVVAGPGIGTSEYACSMIRCLIDKYKQGEISKMIFDADALNIISCNKDIRESLIQDNKNNTKNYNKNDSDNKEMSTDSDTDTGFVITPHMGEMSRLTGEAINEIKENPAFYALRLANEFNCITVLKDAVTTVCFNNNIYYNTAGNPGMATAGSGDVLSGIIAGMMLSGMKGYMAVCMGVYIHSVAGDEAAIHRGTYSMKANDINEELSAVISKYTR